MSARRTLASDLRGGHLVARDPDLTHAAHGDAPRQGVLPCEAIAGLNCRGGVVGTAAMRP